jgi:pimeloyl-ACP methyl ester carboxylesterase
MHVTTYVLIPGAGGAAWYWHRVVAELEHRGQRAIAVDLPADDDTKGLRDYADLVVKAIKDSGSTEVTLVAQSLGGFLAPLVCQQVPVQMLIFVNAMIPNPGETAGDWWGNTGQGQAMRDNDVRERRPTDSNLNDNLDVYFFHDVPPQIVQEGEAHDRPQSGTPFAQPCEFQWPDIPIKVISGRDDRLFPVDFQRRIALERLGITPDVVPGGHLVSLSQPQELVDQMQQYTR